MKAGMMCGLAKVRRKKIPNLFLGICILVTAALLVNACILLNELQAVFDRAYEGMEGTQVCCMWNRKKIPADVVRQFLDGVQAKDTFRYQITEHTKTIDYVEKDGKKLSNGILLELPETVSREMLSPKITDAAELEKVEMPKEGGIWVTAKMAGILHLKTGDTVFLRLADASVPMEVEKIVADPAFGGSNTNVYRMWCGYGQLSGLPLADNDAVSYLEVRFHTYSKQAEQDFIENAEAYFHMPLGDTMYTYDKIKSGYVTAYQMVGAVLCFVSAVLALAIAVLMLFLVKSDMDEDIRNIGIYKSLGMAGIQVVGVYLACYGTVGFAGALCGSLLGGWLNRAVMVRILGDIGIHAVSISGTAGYQVLVWMAVWMAVMLICFCAIFKVRRLNASCAVRSGTWQVEKGTGKRRGRKKGTEKEKAGAGVSYHAGVSFELYYAVRGMRNKKVRYAYIAGISGVLGCLLAVCIGCLHAIQNIDQDPEVWGFIRTDIYVASLEDTPVSAVIGELEKDPRVRYAYGVNKVNAEYAPPGKATSYGIATELYELPWKEEIKDRSLYGRRPLQEHEISVGLALADTYGLKVGDSMELSLNGQKKAYEITGIFQTLSNYGNVIRMVTDSLDGSLTDGYGDYMLVLTKGTDKWAYAQELTEKYGGKFTFLASKSDGENITGSLVPAAGTVLAVLFGVTMLITVNLTFLFVRREQSLIGSLKAVGMTSWQVLKIYLWRNCLCALAGNGLGLLAGTFLMPKLLTPYARKLGLTEFPFSGSLPGVLAGTVLLPACMLVGTCMIVGAIGRISVKQLVNE